MAERKPGLVERAKKFGKDNVFAVGEAYLGLLLATGFPALIPTVAGVIFVYKGVDRFKKAWDF